MHELSIAKDLFSQMAQIAEERKLSNVHCVKILLGKASGIDPQFLHHSLVEHLFPGTFAQKTKVEIIPQSIRLRCRTCQKEWSDELDTMACPSCKSTDFDIIGGNEVNIGDLEGVPVAV